MLAMLVTKKLNFSVEGGPPAPPPEPLLPPAPPLPDAPPVMVPALPGLPEAPPLALPPPPEAPPLGLPPVIVAPATDEPPPLPELAPAAPALGALVLPAAPAGPLGPSALLQAAVPNAVSPAATAKVMRKPRLQAFPIDSVPQAPWKVSRNTSNCRRIAIVLCSWLTAAQSDQ
jgi:hypothetical protein